MHTRGHQRQHTTNSESPRIPAEFIEMLMRWHVWSSWCAHDTDRLKCPHPAVACTCPPHTFHGRNSRSAASTYRACKCVLPRTDTCPVLVVSAQYYRRLFVNVPLRRAVHSATRAIRLVPFMPNTQLTAPLITHKCVENPLIQRQLNDATSGHDVGRARRCVLRNSRAATRAELHLRSCQVAYNIQYIIRAKSQAELPAPTGGNTCMAWHVYSMWRINIVLLGID